MYAINPEMHVCNYDDALELFNKEIPQLLYIGSPVFLKESREFMTIIDIKEDRIDLRNHLTQKTMIDVLLTDIIKAYSAVELGLMLPVEYIAPVNTERGWAWISNEGNVVLEDKFYKTEASARARFILYFLKLTVLELSDIITTLQKNIKLLG